MWFYFRVLYKSQLRADILSSLRHYFLNVILGNASGTVFHSQNYEYSQKHLGLSWSELCIQSETLLVSIDQNYEYSQKHLGFNRSEPWVRSETLWFQSIRTISTVRNTLVSIGQNNGYSQKHFVYISFSLSLPELYSQSIAGHQRPSCVYIWLLMCIYMQQDGQLWSMKY